MSPSRIDQVRSPCDRRIGLFLGSVTKLCVARDVAGDLHAVTIKGLHHVCLAVGDAACNVRMGGDDTR
jgi:hypothetical protein